MDIVKCPVCRRKLAKKSNGYTCIWCSRDFASEEVIDQNVGKEQELIDAIRQPISEKEKVYSLAEEVLHENRFNEVAAIVVASKFAKEKPEEFQDKFKKFAESDASLFEDVSKFVIRTIDFEQVQFVIEVSNKRNDKILNKKASVTEEDENDYTIVNNPDVYVCCSELDEAVVSNVIKKIEEADMTCWVSYKNAPKGNASNAFRREAIEKAVNECLVFLVVSSKNCMRSEDAKYAVDLALSLNLDRVEYRISKIISYTNLFNDFLGDEEPIDATENDRYSMLVKVLEDSVFVEQEEPEEESEEIDESKTRQNIDSQSSNTSSESYDDYDRQTTKESYTVENQFADSSNESVDSTTEETHDYDEWENSTPSDSEHFNDANYAFEKMHNVISAYESLEKIENYSDSAELYNEIGKAFYKGNLCDKDYGKALNCFIKSANYGCLGGMMNAGLCYERGKGTKIDLNKAAKYYEKASSMGNILAKFRLGLIYIADDSPLYNPSLAYPLLLDAAKDNQHEAQYQLGRIYYYGTGIPSNRNKAWEWIERAISNGSSKAADFKSRHYNTTNSKTCALELDE